MHRCTDAQMHRCTDARMQGCTDAEMHGCVDARMHGCGDARMQGCTDAQMHGCTDARMHGCADARMRGCTDARMHGCTDARMHYNFNLYIKLCCQMTRLELKNAMIGHGHRELSIGVIRKGKITWTEAKEILGLKQRAAIFVSVIRLVMWHWLQPISYVLVLYAYWDLIDPMQRLLGLVVAVREVIYFGLSVICIVVNPSYLMIDLRATAHYYSWWYVVQYVLSPVKSICSVLIRTHLNRKRRSKREVEAWFMTNCSADHRVDDSHNYTKTMSFPDSHNKEELVTENTANTVSDRTMKPWDAPRFNGPFEAEPELIREDRLHCFSNGLVGHDMAMLVLIVMDMSGIAALVWAVYVRKVYAALAVGYGITALDGVFQIVYYMAMIPFWCISDWFK